MNTSKDRNNKFSRNSPHKKASVDKVINQCVYQDKWMSSVRDIKMFGIYC